MWANHRSLKLADSGIGMHRAELRRAWSYFYSSMPQRPESEDDVTAFHQGQALAGFGFGLPTSRALARYFSGDLDINSLPGRGTDLYIYL